MRRWLLVAEAPGDAAMLCALTDKVVIDTHDWALGILDNLRSFAGLDDGRSYATWGDLKALAQDRGLRVQGRFGRGHGGAARLEIRRIQALWIRGHITADAVIAHRDTDEHIERAEQARDERDRIEADTPERPICLALPHPEMEAWRLVIAGISTDEERSRHAKLRSTLGFDPVHEPERMRAGAEHDKNGQPISSNAKNVLGAIHPDPAVVHERLEQTSVEVLQTLGPTCGLAAFISDLRARLPAQVGT